MTTQAMAAPPVRAVRDARLAGLAGLVAPHVALLAWSLLSSAIWGAGWRLAAFVDPAASRPPGDLAASLFFTVALGALLGGALALSRRASTARWGLWAAFAIGVVLSAAAMGAASLRQPVLPLLIASSALGFRFGARR
jgi:hypothetical protein